MAEQIPSIGRIVQYTLSADDAEAVNRRRTTGASIFERMRLGVAGYHTDEGSPISRELRAWPAGAQAHIGNDAHEGDVFPLLITRVFGNVVNGQVLLDGTDVLWVTSVAVGEGPRTFKWPTRS